MCATQSNTSASPIMSLSLVRGLWFRRHRVVPGDVLLRIRNVGGSREEAQLRRGGISETVRGPGLVPDDLDSGAAYTGKTPHDVLDLSQHRGGKRAPSRRKEQLDPCMAPIDAGLVQEPH